MTTTIPNPIPVTTLTDRQERFIHEYLIDQNARAAARRAGYSEKSAGSQARDLMRDPRVMDRIRVGLDELFAGLKITARNLLERQARIAFFDPRKLFDTEGNPVPLDKLDEATASVLLVNYGKRKNGDWTQHVRQPSRMQALIALEKRYLKYLEIWGKVGEEEVEEPEEVPKPPQAPAPRPAHPAVSLAPVPPAALPVARAPVEPPAAPGKLVSALRALWPTFLQDKDDAAEGALLAQSRGMKEPAKKPEKKSKQPKEMPYHMQFAHLDPPNLAVLKDVPFDQWPEKARKYYRVRKENEPLPPYMNKPRPLYGDPGPVFRD